MHRTHGVEQVAPAMDALRGAGITNVSLDLIYAVPSDLGREWGADLERALALDPPHISLYGLTVEPATPLFHWTRRGETSLAPPERAAEEYLEAQRTLAGAGYTAYEVSNLSKPGCQSRHNSAYWLGAPFLGLGPSAHGGAGHARWWNVRDWAEYLRRSLAGEPVQGGREELDPAARRLEQLYLGLRTDQGVPEELVPAPVAMQWGSAGWAERNSGRLRLTVEGWLRLDALVAAVPDP
jgi:oxygen-independent coproporphyrinogen-3 oxidase